MSNHNRQRGALSGWAKRRLGCAAPDAAATKAERETENAGDAEGEQLPKAKRGSKRIRKRGS